MSWLNCKMEMRLIHPRRINCIIALQEWKGLDCAFPSNTAWMKEVGRERERREIDSQRGKFCSLPLSTSHFSPTFFGMIYREGRGGEDGLSAHRSQSGSRLGNNKHKGECGRQAGRNLFLKLGCVSPLLSIPPLLNEARREWRYFLQLFAGGYKAEAAPSFPRADNRGSNYSCVV